MKQHRRAQTALEFLVLIGFMLLVFTTFSFVLKSHGSTVAQQSRYNELASIAQTLSEEVSNANRVQDGYERTFELPLTINGEPYTIEFYGANEKKTEFTVKTKDEEYLLFLSTNVTVFNSQGLEASSLQPGRNIITKIEGNISVKPALDQWVICKFVGINGHRVNCYPSTGGSCTTAPSDASCKVRVTGLIGQKITFTSSCGADPQELEFTDEDDQEVTLTCKTVTKNLQCRFNPNPTTATQSCWSTSHPQYTCADKNVCTMSVTTLVGEEMTWRSTCGQTRVFQLTESAEPDLGFTCNNPVTEPLTCLFLENPASDSKRMCYEKSTPTVNCTALPGQSQCTLSANAMPGLELVWRSNECEGTSRTIMTTEEKRVPFFCNVH